MRNPKFLTFFFHFWLACTDVDLLCIYHLRISKSLFSLPSLIQLNKTKTKSQHLLGGPKTVNINIYIIYYIICAALCPNGTNISNLLVGLVNSYTCKSIYIGCDLS